MLDYLNVEHKTDGTHRGHGVDFVQATDPALDAANGVIAKDRWWDTTLERAGVRNGANTDWVFFSADDGDAAGQLPDGATSAVIQAALDDESFGPVVTLPSGTTTITAVPNIARSDLWFRGHADGTSKLLQLNDINDGLGTSHTIMIGKDSLTRIENVRISGFAIEHDRVVSPDMRSAAIDLYYHCDNLKIDNIEGINLTSDFFIGRPSPWDEMGCDGLVIEDIEITGMYEGGLNWHGGKGQNGHAKNIHIAAGEAHVGYQGPMLFEFNIEQTVGSFENFEASDCSLVLTGTASIGGGNSASLGIVHASNSPRGNCWYDKIRYNNVTINGAAVGAYYPAPNHTQGALPAQKTLVTHTDVTFLNCGTPYYIYPNSVEQPAPQVVGNVCVRGASASYATWRTSYAADQEVYAKITNPTDLSLNIRIEDVNDRHSAHYEFYFVNTTTAQIYKSVTAGLGTVYTQLGADITITHASNDEWKFRAAGSTLTVYKNGASVATRTDSSVTGAGYVGVNILGATTSINDFGGGATATTALLDNFNRADEDPIDPANWLASGGWRTGSANDRIVFIRCTGDTNVPIEDQSRLGANGEINVDELDIDWT